MQIGPRAELLSFSAMEFITAVHCAGVEIFTHSLCPAAGCLSSILLDKLKSLQHKVGDWVVVCYCKSNFNASSSAQQSAVEILSHKHTPPAQINWLTVYSNLIAGLQCKVSLVGRGTKEHTDCPNE